MIKTIYNLIICHFIGDYILQTDFLARTKGINWWHMIAHCFLYSVPFTVVFGLDWRLLVVILSHIIIDPLKARWQKIGYATDQLLHLVVLTVYLI